MKTMLMMMVLVVALLPLGCVGMVWAKMAGRSWAMNATAAGTVFGPAVWFAQEGATVETVSVSAATAPAGSVLTTWRELGSPLSVRPRINRGGGTKVRIYNTSKGAWVTARKVNEQVDLAYELVLQEVDDLIIALAHAADGVNGSDAYTPAGTDAKVLGYLLFKQYDETTVVNTVKVWGELMVTAGPNAEEAAGNVTVMFQVLDNANNTGVTAGGLAG